MRRRLDQLTSEFVKEHGEFALERIDAEEADAAAILEAIQSLPFLANRKMVVLRSLGANKTASGQIEQFIDAAGDGCDVIFYEPFPDKRTSYFKVLKSKTNLEEFDEMDPRGLASWLVEEAKRQDGQLSLSDANYMVERVGTNQELLANELEKLLIYDPAISRQSIDELTVKTPQSKVFDLLDAAFGGNKKRALELYDEQRAQKVEPQAIMAMIAWQLELIALAHLAKGKAANQIARDAGVSPYPIQKAQRLAAKLDRNQLTEMINTAAEFDYKSKTVTFDLDEALKTYIVTI